MEKRMQPLDINIKCKEIILSIENKILQENWNTGDTICSVSLCQTLMWKTCCGLNIINIYIFFNNKCVPRFQICDLMLMFNVSCLMFNINLMWSLHYSCLSDIQIPEKCYGRSLNCNKLKDLVETYFDQPFYKQQREPSIIEWYLTSMFL